MLNSYSVSKLTVIRVSYLCLRSTKIKIDITEHMEHNQALTVVEKCLANFTSIRNDHVLCFLLGLPALWLLVIERDIRVTEPDARLAWKQEKGVFWWSVEVDERLWTVMNFWEKSCFCSLIYSSQCPKSEQPLVLRHCQKLKIAPERAWNEQRG